MPTRIFEPAAYDPAPKKLVDHPATMVDVRDFFCDYVRAGRAR
jgi:RNA-dependent RNA polymerase